MLKIVTNSVQETAVAGYKLGSILQGGDVVCLTGMLGTGKTAFAGGIAEALGISGYITSPTFTIVNEYKGRIPLYHFDVYRIAQSDEMFEVGFEEYLEAGGITVIEWAELIEDILPEERIMVKLDKDIAAHTAADIDKRIISVKFIGSKYAHYEGRLDI